MVISYIRLRTLIEHCGCWGGAVVGIINLHFSDSLVRSLCNTKFRNWKCGEKRLWTRRSGFSLLLVSRGWITSCVTLARSFHFAEPQFPHLQKGAVCRAEGLLSKDSFVRSIMRV